MKSAADDLFPSRTPSVKTSLTCVTPQKTRCFPCRCREIRLARPSTAKTTTITPGPKIAQYPCYAGIVECVLPLMTATRVLFMVKHQSRCLQTKIWEAGDNASRLELDGDPRDDGYNFCFLTSRWTINRHSSYPNTIFFWDIYPLFPSKLN